MNIIVCDHLFHMQYVQVSVQEKYEVIFSSCAKDILIIRNPALI